MPRIARIVVVDYPHHVIQRGNRKQQVFFKDSDYQNYLRLLKEHSSKHHLKIVAYCLMPNHVHLIIIPMKSNSLSKAIGGTHQKYTKAINSREDWCGYLWQGRFSSYVLDENYLYTAVRYILFNPVKARMVKKAEDYQWSSVRHHMRKENINFVEDEVLNGMITDWKLFLEEESLESDVKLLKKHANTGRPLGGNVFLEKLEKKLGISLKKKKPGPKKQNINN